MPTQGQPQCCCAAIEPPDEDCYQFCAYTSGTPIAFLITFGAATFTGALEFLNGVTVSLDALRFCGLTCADEPSINVPGACVWYYCGPDEDNSGKFVQIVMYSTAAGFGTGSGVWTITLNYNMDACPGPEDYTTGTPPYAQWYAFVDFDGTGCSVGNLCDDLDCCDMPLTISFAGESAAIVDALDNPSITAEECFA